jgi:hypothetical protein
MIFWIAVLAGVLFVWLAIRMGFYETWVLFFNTVVSIYVSVFLAPMLIEFVPAPSGAASYHVALCLIVLAGGVFALLQGLSYVFLTGQFHIPFPRVFDIVLSGVVGFATGFLVLSFLGLILTTTPLAENKIVGIFGLTSQPRQANLVCLTRCCDVIHAFAGFSDAGNTTQAAVQRLLEVPKADSHPNKRASEANEPSKPQPPKEATPRKGRRTIDYDMQ